MKTRLSLYCRTARKDDDFYYMTFCSMYTRPYVKPRFTYNEVGNVFVTMYLYYVGTEFALELLSPVNIQKRDVENTKMFGTHAISRV
jgi:hypothetical protein